MSDYDAPKPKRAKKNPKHDSTVVLLDVGSNMAKISHGREKCDLDMAKEVLNWIITRKIFSKSPDEFTLVLFGSEETKNDFGNGAKNIFFCEDEMQSARIDWLKLIENEIKPSRHVQGDFMSALIVALDYMRSSLEVAQEGEILSRNILMISNLEGGNVGDSLGDSTDSDSIVTGMKALGINFSVVGASEWWDNHQKPSQDTDEPHDDSMGDIKHDGVKMDPGEKILSNIANQVDGLVYSFKKALPLLQHFVPRRVNIRSQNFILELGSELRLPLQLFKKNQEPDMKMTFAKVDQVSGVEVKRETVHERPAGDDSTKQDTETAGSSTVPQVLRKEDIIKGYTFGSTIVPFNEEDQEEYGWKRETRCMKLLQFTKRSQEGAQAISALVQAMIEENSVALVRYVYNAASNPKIMALFPRSSNKGVDMLMGIILPFYEDFRGLEFPPINDDVYKPKGEQKRAIEAFVDVMDLSNSFLDPETGEYGEDLRPRNVPNPKLQRVCEAMKFRALHPGEELPQFESDIVNQLMQPRAQLVKMASEPLSYIQKTFPLEEIVKKKRHGVNFDPLLETNDFPSFGEDGSSLPEGARFIGVKEVKKEDLGVTQEIKKEESVSSDL